MRKIFLMLMLCICAVVYATPKVDGITVRLTDYPVISPTYDTTYSVLDDKINMYVYSDHAVAIPNEPRHVICRVRINKQWYRIPYRDFTHFYYGRRLSRKEIAYIKQLNNK